MEAENKSIKETKELFAGLGLVAKEVKGALADGKINVNDVQHILNLGKQHQVLIDAVNGVKEIPAELKDLDKAELLEIIMLVYKEIA
jgi:hypothetical protein